MGVKNDLIDKTDKKMNGIICAIFHTKKKMVDSGKATKRKSKARSKKTPPTANCCICEDKIKDQSQNDPGEDSIFCDGNCQGWIHRSCAGLARDKFNTLSIRETHPSIYCPQCWLHTVEKRVP